MIPRAGSLKYQNVISLYNMAITTALDKDPCSSNVLLCSMASVHQMMGGLRDRIRQLYFRAVLLAKACPACNKPDLVMIRRQLVSLPFM